MPGLCLVAEEAGELVGSLRFWQVRIFDRPHLLLGPLAVRPDLRGKGYGKALVRQGLGIASQGIWGLCVISGEPDYYPRFDFQPVPPGQLIWPGFLEPERLQIKGIESRGWPGCPPARLPSCRIPDRPFP